MFALRRWRPLILIVGIWLLFMYYLYRDDYRSASSLPPTIPQTRPGSGHHGASDAEDLYKGGAAENGGEIGAGRWRKLPEQYPVANPRGLPKITPGVPSKIPKIQAKPPPESTSAREERLKRRAAVKESFVHSWGGYKKYAWMSDEVTPLTGHAKNPFGGWAATLVDALDSLWIMGLEEEFEEAVKAAEGIDFSKTQQDRVNVFETTIRYMGGFLAAYELSGKKYPGLLKKAVEVGELLLCAFDTKNHMPIARWDWKYYMTGHKQDAHRDVLVSELGSLSLEFTKLSQLTGDVRYYDAVQRISDAFEAGQGSTTMPGMWPITVDMSKPSGPSFSSDNTFTLGGMSDSLYEYFPKQYLILGGVLEQPRTMYEKFIAVAKEQLFRRALNPDNIPIIISGDVSVRVMDKAKNEYMYVTKGQHLTCFVGGMVALAAKIFDRPDDLGVAEQLTDGCVWAYQQSPHGMMPEIFSYVPCGNIDESQTGKACKYSEEKWRSAVGAQYSPGNSAAADIFGASMDKLIKDKGLVPGMTNVLDKKYILRPEAIESVFIMYRLTGDRKWAEKAWTMFEAIEKNTRTGIAAAGIRDVMNPNSVDHSDSMESFWLAETLKYFYLVFSEFDVVDLDRWVLNTEAHPLSRPDVA